MRKPSGVFLPVFAGGLPEEHLVSKSGQDAAGQGEEQFVFTVYSGNDPGSTLVSNLFIDNYMKDANDAQLKVYLYLLRMMDAGMTTSISDMAVRFNHTERDIARSLRYWEDRGLIALEYSSGGEILALHMLSPAADHAPSLPAKAPAMPRLQQMAIPVQNAVPAQNAAPAQNSAPVQGTAPLQNAVPMHGAASMQNAAPMQNAVPMHSATSMENAASIESAVPAQNAVSSPAPAAAGDRAASGVPAVRTSSRQPDAVSVEAFRNSAKRAQLLFVIEQYIGKPLAPSEVESVYYISEELHFSDALIDYLLQYCIDRGKKDFRYIEKVAVNWAEHGITTPKQAERAVSGFGKNRRGYSGVKPSANPFNQFEQNQYDFDQLEREILSN